MTNINTLKTWFNDNGFKTRFLNNSKIDFYVYGKMTCDSISVNELMKHPLHRFSRLTNNKILCRLDR